MSGIYFVEAGITTGVAVGGVYVAKNEKKIIKSLKKHNKKARNKRREEGKGKFDKKIDKEEAKLAKADDSILNELQDAFNNAFQGTVETLTKTDDHDTKKHHGKKHHHHDSKKEVAKDVATGNAVEAEVVDTPKAAEEPAPAPQPNPVLNPDGTVNQQLFAGLQNQQ